MKVVLDGNVILSALIFPESKPACVLKLAKKDKIELYLSQFIVKEIKKNLSVKFDYSESLSNKVISELLKFGKIVIIKKQISLIHEKSDDNRILEIAISAKADYLISGDKKHILPLKIIGNTKIVSTSDFLDEFSA